MRVHQRVQYAPLPCPCLTCSAPGPPPLLANGQHALGRGQKGGLPWCQVAGSFAFVRKHAKPKHGFTSLCNHERTLTRGAHLRLTCAHMQWWAPHPHLPQCQGSPQSMLPHARVFQHNVPSHQLLPKHTLCASIHALPCPQVCTLPRAHLGPPKAGVAGRLRPLFTHGVTWEA